MSWIPLHVHSQYSILASTALVDALVDRAALHKMPALALTDQGNLHGTIEFYKACKGAGIKPIIGCELVLASGSRREKKRTAADLPLLLFAKNLVGYRNLCKLSTLAHLEGFYYTPRIDKEALDAHSEGLLCVSGSLESRLGYLIVEEKREEVTQEIQWLQTLFQEDLYFELQRHEMSEQRISQEGLLRETWLRQLYLNHIRKQKQLELQLRELSSKYAIPCVATNSIHYLEPQDGKAHEILMNIQSGEPCEIWEKDSLGNPKTRVANPKRRVHPTYELYFKSPQQMSELFADFPEAYSAAKQIADKCQLELDLHTKHYPLFIPPALEGKSFTEEERKDQAERFLRQTCEEEIEKRYGDEALRRVQEKYPDRNPMEVVKERLNHELQIITSKGMCDYLLIVYDFIAWAKGQHIPVGPGRGSGAGSIILYLLRVTDIEPLRFHLFFERFINPERLAYPDIDVDICMDRRGEVIDYTVRKYGAQRVAQIITFNTMKAKMAIRDVGRVLSVPLSKVNAIATLVPEELGITLDKALELDQDLRRLYNEENEVHEVIDIAKRLEGCIRSSSIHAAGLIISADPLVEHIPLCTAKDSSMAVTQFSMKPVEAVGMLKIDFLGLKTLTSIQHAVDALGERGSIHWMELPLDDALTFQLLTQGKTMGIFQLESPGMQDLAKQLHIDRFEELIAVCALYRPGPMEMIPSFIQRKHGQEPIEIDHPLMANVLSETYGIMVYQEQVMQIASLLAGYSLGEGDVLRRAMGKKDRDEMARQREKFRTGALRNGIDEGTAMRIFDKIEKFASYGFNKSHAAAYAYLGYVTAYLKAHFPKEWMAALMTSDRDDITKLTKLMRECTAMGIPILAPDVNESGKAFVATQGGIRFALTGIKGVGEGVVQAILEERRARGPFSSLFQFFQRTDTKKVGKKAVELLIEAGGFDYTGWSRSALLQSVEPMHEVATQEQLQSQRGILSVFSLLAETQERRFAKPPEEQKPLLRHEMLKREYELLGFYLCGHPLDEYQQRAATLSCAPLGALEQMADRSVFRTIFVIEAVSTKISTKTQKKFAILTISDATHRFELPIWYQMYEEKKQLLTETRLIYAILQLEKEGAEIKLQCRWLEDLTILDDRMIQESQAAFDRAVTQSKTTPTRPSPSTTQHPQRKLTLTIDADTAKLSYLLQLKKLLRANPGEAPVAVRFISQGRTVGVVEIDSSWGVQERRQLEEGLRTLPTIQDIGWS